MPKNPKIMFFLIFGQQKIDRSDFFMLSDGKLWENFENKIFNF